ncbi:MAG: two-component regulator propeller domain-containing protein [Prevotella sp.]
MKRAALFIASLFYTWLAMANNYDFTFRHYSAYDGLWSNAVWTVIQDKKGYIWIGADAGLKRFDGISMRQFNIGKISSSQSATALLEIGDSILIGTFNGVYILKLSTEEIRFFDIKADDGSTIKSQVMSISCDKDGGVWFATMGQGVYRHQLSSNT